MRGLINCTIYQLEDLRATAYGFMNWNFAKSHNFSISDYKEVYSAELEEGETDTDTLENLFVIFNTDHPDDYTGHSLSVSDVVKIKNRYYYCDSFGWEDITKEV